MEELALIPQRCKRCNAAVHFVMSCGHRFCKPCLGHYLDAPCSNFTLLLCPLPSCGLDATHSDLIELLGQEYADTYERSLLSALERGELENSRAGEIYRAFKEFERHIRTADSKPKVITFKRDVGKVIPLPAIARDRADDGTGFGWSNSECSSTLSYSRNRNLDLDVFLSRAIDSFTKFLGFARGNHLTATMHALVFQRAQVVRFVELLVRNDSVVDISLYKVEFHKEAFSLLNTMASFPELMPLLLASREVAVKTRNLVRQMLRLKPTMTQQDAELATEVHNWYKHVKETCTRGGAQRGELEQVYMKKLKPLQFQVISTRDSGFQHHFNNEKSDSSRNARRIHKELSVLAVSLPLEWGSSIHVRVVQDRLDLIKAAVIGPAGTPYQNGIFFFDLYLPPRYPRVPPKVYFRTTGGGRVRFNANLDRTGELCLTLLDAHGSGWVPGECTLLQVLVSIQALIFTENPYYNLITRPVEDDKAAERENGVHKANTLRFAVLEAMRKPDKMFESVIKEHFRVKRRELEAQCDEWLSCCEGLGIMAKLRRTVACIKSELRALDAH